jgi:GH15 family glucan-1,4-alpha-glucosidase
MPERIEDYGLIGDCRTVGLIGRDGSLDWLCVPSRWLLAPRGEVRACRRRYREGTLILETEFETPGGTAALIDFMPIRDRQPNLVRIVEGRAGRVEMHTDLIFRFDYGSAVPWVQKVEGGLQAVAGPDALRLYTAVPLRGANFTTIGRFTVIAGQRVPFTLTYHASYQPPPKPIDPLASLAETEDWWRKWSDPCECRGP